MIGKPSLLMLTAAASALAAVANGVVAATPTTDAPANKAQDTRLGRSIEQDISKADAEAAKRKRALDMREQATKAAENRLQKQIASQPAPGTPGAPGSQPEGPPEEQYDDLARIYQAMKPKQAAIVFEQLDIEVQMKIATRMRDRSMALILANMSPRAAAVLSMALARKHAPTVRPATAAAQTPPRKR
ncbi:MAG: MotE family protein [Pseudomonadota bacterium]